MPLSNPREPAQLILPGCEDFTPPPKTSHWQPCRGTLGAIQAYFSGYQANGREIFPKRKTIVAAIKRLYGLTLSVRHLARYLRYLSEVGWMRTVKRKARTAIREVFQQSVEENVPSYVPSLGPGPSCDGTEEKPARLRESVEIPPQYVQTEAGGRVRNWVYFAIAPIMRMAQERIRRARNPKAYHDAILRAELAKLDIAAHAAAQ